jgi:hypothetical protein
VVAVPLNEQAAEGLRLTRIVRESLDLSTARARLSRSRFGILGSVSRGLG